MTSVTDSVGQLSALQRAAITIKQLRFKLDSLEQERSSPIAVVGLGCRFPGGADSPEAFWELLINGDDCLEPIPPNRWEADRYFDPDPSAAGKILTRCGYFLRDVENFDADFFRISPREALSLDPQQRLLLEVCWEALEHAGIAADGLRDTQTGVFVGIGQNDYALRRMYAGDPACIGTYDGTGNGFCFASGRLAYTLGLQGPTLAVDTACSSSLVATHLACQSLRLRECDLALAGGVQLILEPDVTVFLSRAHALAPDGRCKTFDAAADGYGRGEGCGMLVLKRLVDAQAANDPILAVIRGSAVNHNGASSGVTVPNASAQQALLRQALKAARLEPAQMDYLETHGTGTSLGDPIEVRSLDAVMREGRDDQNPLLIGAVKTNIGHLEAAAGVAGLIKTVLALQKGVIPGSLHCRTPNPAIPWDRVRVALTPENRPWPRRGEVAIAGVSSFGISGTNAHVILEQRPPAPLSPESLSRPLHLVPLSAHSHPALAEQARMLAAHLRLTPGLRIEDIGYTLGAGRSHHPYRVGILAESSGALQAQLHAIATGTPPLAAVQGTAEGPPALAGLFTGQGSHSSRMGLELYQTQPTFRRVMDDCARLLAGRLDVPLLEVLSAPDGSPSWLDQTCYAQPALFALEYALAELWSSWGIQPGALLGHSVGELVAACRAGVFTLEEGLALVAERGRLMQALPQDGSMLAVMADLEQVRDAIGGQAVSLAAVNGPARIVLSGSRAAIERVRERFQVRQIRTQVLNTSHAFHSDLIEPMLDAFEAFAEQIHFGLPKVPIVSNLTGLWADERIATPSYWRQHARQPVLFAQGMRTLAQRGFRAFLELGPDPVLLGLGRQCLSDDDALWLPSLRRGQPAWQMMLSSLAALYVNGAPVDWQGVDRDTMRHRLHLPTYPFQRQRFWIERSEEQRTQHVETPGYRLVWQARTRAARLPEVPGAWLLLGGPPALAEELGRLLIRHQHTPLYVTFGEAFTQTAPERWEIRPESALDFQQLLRALPLVPPHILCLWPTQETEDPAASVRIALEERDCTLLTHLVQAVLSQGMATRLWAVTSGSAPLFDEPPKLEHACVWGFGKVLALEHPEIWGGLIDLPHRPDDGDIAELFAEVAQTDGEDHVALRRGQRYVERLESAPVSPGRITRMRSDATYLITGGLGALGLHVASRLAEQGARAIVLLGRRPPGAEAEQALDPLRRLVPDLRVLRADVTDLEQLKAIFSTIGATMPPLRGIVHAAGVLGEWQVIEGLDAHAFPAVLRPKLLGAMHLHALSRDLALDWFVSFSSIASAWGSRGQAPYAAANQFLDHFAHHRTGLGLPTLSINWGPWAEGGMASESARSALAAMGLRGISTRAALDSFQRWLSSPLPQVVLAEVDWPRFREIYTARRARPLLDAWAEPPAPDVLTPGAPAPALAELTAGERLDWLLELVRREAAAVLSLADPAELDLKKGFFRLGLDSLMAVELKDRLARALHVKLSPTVIFDYPTVLELATQLGTGVLGLELRSPAETTGAHREDAQSEDAGLFSLDARLSRLEALLDED